MDGYGYREVILIPYMEENENTIFKTYEEAELECLVKLIDIVKKQNIKFDIESRRFYKPKD